VDVVEELFLEAEDEVRGAELQSFSVLLPHWAHHYANQHRVCGLLSVLQIRAWRASLHQAIPVPVAVNRWYTVPVLRHALRHAERAKNVIRYDS